MLLGPSLKGYEVCFFFSTNNNLNMSSVLNLHVLSSHFSSDLSADLIKTGSELMTSELNVQHFFPQSSFKFIYVQLLSLLQIMVLFVNLYGTWNFPWELPLILLILIKIYITPYIRRLMALCNSIF